MTEEMKQEMKQEMRQEMEHKGLTSEQAALLQKEGRNVLSQGEKHSLAAVIAGVTGVPEAVQLIQLAILAVWSANEAVAEVKSLLAGGEVPLLKMSGSGYLNLDYRGYVRLLLYMKRTETLQGRGLDVIQTDMMRRVSTFDVRRCIYSSEIRVTAQSGAVFTRVFAVGGSRMFRGTELFADCGNSYAVERLG